MLVGRPVQLSARGKFASLFGLAGTASSSPASGSNSRARKRPSRTMGACPLPFLPRSSQKRPDSLLMDKAGSNMTGCRLRRTAGSSRSASRVAVCGSCMQGVQLPARGGRQSLGAVIAFLSSKDFPPIMIDEPKSNRSRRPRSVRRFHVWQSRRLKRALRLPPGLPALDRSRLQETECGIVRAEGFQR